MKFIMIEDLKSPTKIWSEIYFIDVAFIFIYLSIAWLLSEFVHPKLTTAFLIYNLFVSLILTRQSKSNPKKRIWQSIYYVLISNRNVYKPIAREIKKNVL